MIRNKSLSDYEKTFIKYFADKYNVKYIKVKNNHKQIPTQIFLYNENKRLIKNQPIPKDVTLVNMFDWLIENKVYSISEIYRKEGEGF